MTDFLAQQQALADQAFEKFNFDADISVNGFGHWDVSPNDGADDYSKIVSVTCVDNDESVEPREVSFHVKFKAGTLEVDESYAYWMKNGGEIFSVEAEKNGA